MLDTFDDSTGTVKGSIRLVKASDATKWLTFNVTAVASPSGYRNITVTNTGSSAANPFLDTDAILLCFDRAGDAGTAGATGANGPSSVSYTKLTSDMTATTVTTLANVTSLSFSVSSGVYYVFEFGVLYQSAAATTGLKVSVTIPAATVFTANVYNHTAGADGAATLFFGRITSSDDPVIGSGSEATGTTYLVEIRGAIVPSAGGTLQARFASEVNASTVTIKQGSYGILHTLP